MDSQASINFSRIAKAIDFITANFKEQPSLERIAQEVHMSPAHFQRLFTEWAGTSPKKFLQYISIEHAKSLLKNNSPTLFDVTLETGLSSTSRLHDLFITIEGITPAEFKNGGKNLRIEYSFSDSLFGKVIIASTTKGICYVAFEEDKEKSLSDLKSVFPNAESVLYKNDQHEMVLKFINHPDKNVEHIKLHLKGTEFQLKVWQSLLKIPTGSLTTYGKIADTLNNPLASRAVGTAIGSNLVAYLIPCHRVIQATGVLGGYKWHPTRKKAMIAWESAQKNVDSEKN